MFDFVSRTWVVYDRGIALFLYLTLYLTLLPYSSTVLDVVTVIEPV